MTTAKTQFESRRMLSLDVFRGITIVLMILVNSQGLPVSYPILDHAAWDGCTLADLVFPFFLFIVGVTIVVSLKKQVEQAIKPYKSMVQRAIILFGLGVLLNAFPYHFDLHTIRIYGILQRIALCYFFAGFIYLNTTWRTQLLICIGILLGYWLLLTQIPVPGVGANPWDAVNNWVAYIDRQLLSASHLFYKTSDPEGLLGTLPSLATTLIGVLTGQLLMTDWTRTKKLNVMLGAGLLMLFLGWLWHYDFPINKTLWTSSFVLWTGGFALIFFALTFWLVDMRGVVFWTLPFKIFGMNALFAFIFHVFLLKVQAMFYLPLADGSTVSLKPWITQHLFFALSQQNASLAYALLFIGLNYAVVAWMYRRGIFVRI